jgi:hypothetical protein
MIRPKNQLVQCYDGWQHRRVQRDLNLSGLVQQP